MTTITVNAFDAANILAWAGENLTSFGLKLIGAIIVLIAGFWVVSRIGKGLTALMEKRDFDRSLRGFLKSVSVITLKVLVVITVLSMVGLQMTSFIAILGAAGLAIGMALSGTLQNFAGGVLLLILKPFKVGDFIEAQSFMGTVKDIQIFNTVLHSPDNRKIIIPNGGLATGAVINFSAQPTRRVQWVFGVAYGDDFQKAKQVLFSLLKADKRILDDPAPSVTLSELADSSVDITVRAWVNTSDFWSVFFDMNEKVYETFDKEGLNIPFPQMDVHLQNS